MTEKSSTPSADSGAGRNTRLLGAVALILFGLAGLALGVGAYSSEGPPETDMGLVLVGTVVIPTLYAMVALITSLICQIVEYASGRTSFRRSFYLSVLGIAAAVFLLPGLVLSVGAGALGAAGILLVIGGLGYTALP